jgi:hypothetical protein
LLPVDVVIWSLRRRGANTSYPAHDIFLPYSYKQVLRESVTAPEIGDRPVGQLFGTTALGGTFDHLHSGHKILLTMAAWITRDRVIVGITGGR